jgi:hypothetical protein
MPNTFDFLKPALGDELFAQVEEKLASAKGITLVNTADGSYVPKAKLDEERNISKGYKTQIDELNGELTKLKESATDAEALKNQITQLQSDIASKDAAMKQQQLQYTIKDTIRGSKAKNVDIVLKMLDLSKITDSNGKLYGLDEQIDSLKKSDGYLFESEPDHSGGVDPHHDPEPDKPGSNQAVNDMIRQAAGR